jgi:CBS domain-containing protein
MSAGRICSRVVVTAVPEELVRTAARRMAEQDVGTLVVLKTNGSQEAIGILTDRDIAIRCVAGGLDPDRTPLSGIMTKPVRAIDEEMAIEDAILRMAEARARRLIVTGKNGELVGILSLDDVLGLLAEEAAPIGRLLGAQEPHVHG